MRKKLDEKGLIRGILYIALLIVIIFIAISFMAPYYRYYTLGSHTRDYLKSEITNLPMIEERVMTDAIELGIPLDAKNIEVTQVKKIIKVKAKWSETVDFWGYYQKTFHFTMNEEY
jgi:hypothetical protein